jgi:hypothetical protein
MPKKIRELKNLLLQSGFTCRTGKGSHTNWYSGYCWDAIQLRAGKPRPYGF